MESESFVINKGVFERQIRCPYSAGVVYNTRPRMSRMTPSDDTAMAIDGMGNIVLLNSTHMKVYGRNGDLLRVVGHCGASQGRDRSATFVSAVVDGAGNVVALDQQNCRIVVLSAAGELVRFFGSESGEGALWIAIDVEVDGAGRVYVADWGADRIVVFSAAGVFLRAFGEQGEGKLRHPMRVAVDGAGNVWVADWKLNGPRIVVFSAAGSLCEPFLMTMRGICGRWIWLWTGRATSIYWTLTTTESGSSQRREN